MRLSNENYEKIKREVALFLQDYSVRKLPIDIFKLAKLIRLKVVFASQKLANPNCEISKEQLQKYPNSLVCYDKENNQFIVYIDDVNTSRKRQRFSLAHEIAHIILGHDEQNPINEAEANFAASYLLAPTSLVLLNPNAKALFEARKLEYIFNISGPQSKIVAERNAKRISLANMPPRGYERIINRLLKASLKRRLRECS